MTSTVAEPLATPRLAALYAPMAKRRPGGSGCPFGEKFAQYVARERSSLRAFALRHGLPQRSLHGWVREGRKVPDHALAIIARATGIPADYWVNDTLPWPPAPQYGNLVEEIVSTLQAVPMDQLREIAAMVRDSEDRERTLALRRAAASRPHRP